MFTALVLFMCVPALALTDEPATNWPSLRVHSLGPGSGTNEVEFIAYALNTTNLLVQAGQLIAVRRHGVQYRWKVLSVDKNGITVKKLDATSTTNKQGAAEQPAELDKK